MIRTVTSIEEGFTNTGRLPYALAHLDCRHCVRVELRDTRGVCCGCGAVVTHAHGAGFDRCSCGTWMTGQIDSPKPHLEADRLTKVGNRVECMQCDNDAATIVWLRALPAGLVHHARYDPRFAPGSYRLYRHDVSSPSGFFLIGSCPATPQFDAILREVGISPISPTEAA